MPTARRTLPLIALTVALAAGCSGEVDQSPEATAGRLKASLQRAMPEGWTVAFGRELPEGLITTPVAPDDLVVYRPEAVPLRAVSGAPEPPADRLHFTLARRDFIDPAAYPAIWQENERIRAKREELGKMVAMTPRDPSGELMPRGTAEEQQVSAYKRLIAVVPALREDLPSHYAGPLAFQLLDYRTQLVPVDRSVYAEEARVFLAIEQKLTAYPRK